MKHFVLIYSVSPYDIAHVGPNFATKCCFAFLCSKSTAYESQLLKLTLIIMKFGGSV